MDVEELAMMLHTVQLEPVTPAEFKAAAQKAGLAMASLDQEQQLFLYGLFKQASAGNAPEEGPTDQMTPEYYKWQSWKSFGNFPQPDAAKAYVYVVNNCMSVGSDGGSGDGKGEFNGVGSAVSTLYKTYEDETKWSASEILFEAVMKNDVNLMKEHLKNNQCNIDLLNDEGMSVLHYAADKGNAEMVQLLIDYGANVNILDKENQSPLSFALICEHMDIIQLLLEHGGDWRFDNQDSDDFSDEIKESLQKYGKL